MIDMDKHIADLKEAILMELSNRIKQTIAVRAANDIAQQTSNAALTAALGRFSGGSEEERHAKIEASKRKVNNHIKAIRHITQPKKDD